MPTHRESKPSAPPNIQDVFLNSARRERLVVQIRLMDGQVLEGRIKNFDRADHMVFKHAIATIRSNRSVPNYFSSAAHEA
jgi:host factor-I protein